MEKIKLGKSDLVVPRIAVGCMRINEAEYSVAKNNVYTAIDNGFNFFDHADIYGKGECERVFGKILSEDPSLREKILIQTKCSIKPYYCFDFSKEHIISSVEGSLKRLNTDHIDVLLLHRPDTLFEPEEVAEAFDKLRADGKVLNFGVSNQNREQMELLSAYMSTPIVANQMQLSPVHCPMIQNGLNVNMFNDSSVERGSGIIEFCRLNKITIQPWSPFQHGFIKGTYMNNPDYQPLNDKLDELAKKHNSTKSGIVIAWYMRHPAKFQPVVGTTNTKRLLECFAGCDVELSREEWYEIYMSAGNILP